MSNLHSARSAIEAELAHSRQGLAYYQSLIDALEQALAQLATVEAPSAAKAPTALKRVLAAGRAAGKRAGKSGKPGGDGKPDTRELPFTGGEYWVNLMSDRPKTGVEILKEAIDSLGFAPSKAQAKKLSGRMIFALRTLLAAKKINDTGSGRNRRYFRA